jgi:hypothetical protein
MLMTLLNVRLGYWAPTPNRNQWHTAQARLWPFYTLREFLSETNDLSSYCYLSDGGHFDNTGLYSLVERGCRCIVMADCSGDPERCFADLGNAVRRCRLDFEAEIKLDVTPLLRSAKDDPYAQQHAVAGRIVYSEKHFQALGLSDTSESARTGTIVYIKPGLLKGDQGLPVDVRQYAFENGSFPHQSTANQWFDEAQFESYRRLGQHSLKMALASLAVDDQQYQTALAKSEAGTDLLPEDELALAVVPRLGRIKERQYCTGEVLELFELLHTQKSHNDNESKPEATATATPPGSKPQSRKRRTKTKIDL